MVAMIVLLFEFLEIPKRKNETNLSMMSEDSYSILSFSFKSLFNIFSKFIIPSPRASFSSSILFSEKKKYYDQQD